MLLSVTVYSFSGFDEDHDIQVNERWYTFNCNDNMFILQGEQGTDGVPGEPGQDGNDVSECCSCIFNV